MTADDQGSFAGLLRRLRRRAALSQEELAERAGLTAAAIGALERGERRHPYPHTLHALADALDLTAVDRDLFFRSVAERRRARSRERQPAAEHQLQASIPSPLSPIVGREQDIAIITGLLENGGARLVTICGAGGVGKTRLAIEVTWKVREAFDVAAWVDLSATSDPDAILTAVARALGLPEMPGKAALDTLEAYLASRHCLIVLDNFEHLVAGGRLLASLLERCPRVLLLVTSRETLRIRGEYEVQVRPLAVPDPGASPTAAALLSFEAADLFVRRVRAAVPSFQLNDAEAPAIAAICARLDGIPLALELAAPHMKYLSAAELLDRLDERLDFLQAAPRDLPPRQQSLRATVAWSYNRLTAAEQALFRRIAIFSGGFTEEAAHSVARLQGVAFEHGSLPLAGLVEKSLLEARRDSEGEVRFFLLETVRDYARERLREAREEGGVAEKHAAYFCDLAEAAAPYLTSASRDLWLRQLDAELPNLREALAWTSKDGDVCAGLRLIAALGWFWILRGYVREGSTWTQAHLPKARDQCPLAAWAGALYTAAALAWKAEDVTRAREYAEASLAIRRELADNKAIAFTLALTGLIAISQGEKDRALSCQEESVALFRSIGERWGIAYGLSNFGDALLEAGEDKAAHDCYQEGLDLFSELGDSWGRGLVLNTLGSLAWKQGDARTAHALYEQSVALFRELGNRENTARSLIGLAAAALGIGDTEQAAAHLAESLETWRDFGNKAGEATCIRGLAGVQVEQGRLLEGVRLFAKADRVSEGRNVFMLAPGLFSAYLGQAKVGLSPEEFARAWREGSTSA